MKVDFSNIKEHVILMGDFSLRWRFTEPEYKVLPKIHLNQIKPLDKEASKFLSDYIDDTRLHLNVPFKKDFFKSIDKKFIFEGNEKDVKKWLYQRGIAFEKEVYLCYDSETAIIAPWKLVIKYFDDFHYADDLTVIDQSLNWALLFFHEGEIYFGSNMKYEPAANDNEDFLY